MTETRVPYRPVTRVQTGVRMEKRLLHLLKALAASLDLTFGELLEGIVLHALEGKSAFNPDTLAKIASLREVYHLNIGAIDSHRLAERKRRK